MMQQILRLILQIANLGCLIAQNYNLTFPFPYPLLLCFLHHINVKHTEESKNKNALEFSQTVPAENKSSFCL